MCQPSQLTMLLFKEQGQRVWSLQRRRFPKHLQCHQLWFPHNCRIVHSSSWKVSYSALSSARLLLAVLPPRSGSDPPGGLLGSAERRERTTPARLCLSYLTKRLLGCQRWRKLSLEVKLKVERAFFSKEIGFYVFVFFLNQSMSSITLGYL